MISMRMEGSGTLTLNKPLSKEAVDKIKSTDWSKHSYNDWKDLVEIGMTEIELEEINAKDFDGDIYSLVDEIGPLGYVLNGTIEYWGDYEGKYYITDNECENVDISYTGLIEATDEELIEILEERGYAVTKKEDAA